MKNSRPIIAIVSCHKMVDGQPAQAVYQKYIDAVNFYGGNPILLPNTAADSENFEALLNIADGILLTGSYSNVAPTRYGATHIEAKQDLGRDELSFKLLDYADKTGTPLLAVCRGLQEMNVHFGGTLHPDWREVEGFYEPHLEDNTQPLEVQYQPVHDVIIQPNGRLAAFGEHKVDLWMFLRTWVDLACASGEFINTRLGSGRGRFRRSGLDQCRGTEEEEDAGIHEVIEEVDVSKIKARNLRGSCRHGK